MDSSEQIRNIRHAIIMSETLADDNKKQPWEHSIKSYSVEEILDTFDQRVPKEKETSKWKLMFQIISKLHVVQVQQMTRHFITQLRNLENSLHFSSLTMSETKLVKFIFRQSHHFTAFYIITWTWMR